MNRNGCERKFKVPSYITRVNALVKAVKSSENSSASNPGGWCAATVFGSKASGGVSASEGKTKAARSVACDRDALVRLAQTASNFEKDSERAMDALNALMELPVDRQSLIATEVGKLIRPLTKRREDPKFASVAKSVTEKWKKIVAPMLAT